jgi:hypothetical protein
MAHDHDGSVRVEFCVGAGGYVTHGHEECARNAGGLVLPGFADVQQEGGVLLLALLGKGFGGNFEF